MPVKKILIWAFVIFTAYYLMTQPSNLGHALGGLLDGIKNEGNNLSKFIVGLG